MSAKCQEILIHTQVNSSNVIAGKQTIQVFVFSADMNNQCGALKSLAEQIKCANPAELKEVVEHTLDVCKKCNKTLTNFTGNAKVITDKVGSLLENFSPEVGKSFKDKCTNFLDQANCAKRAAAVENQLNNCLTQQALDRAEILKQIEQQKETINQSIQNAYKFASYCNFATALINFIIAIVTLQATCGLIEQHEKLISEAKAKLAQHGRDLNNYYQEAQKLIENLESIGKQELNISNPMYERLYELSDVVRDVQLDLEKIKSELGIATSKSQLQKNLHTSGAWAGGIGALISTVASVGQIANLWNIGGIILNLSGSIANTIGIHMCKKDLKSLQDLTEWTEILINNANESMKILKSIKNTAKQK
ncbi:unnamed protein product [Rotaria sp. Silwood2]|nr:unnamed protein product [Rotaria sp. Silwood2]